MVEWKAGGDRRSCLTLVPFTAGLRGHLRSQCSSPEAPTAIP